MKPISLFGSGISSYSQVVTAQRRLNCFYDLRPDEDKQKVVVRGTPGTQVWQTLPTYPIRGWHVIGSLIYIVSGAILYSLNSSGTRTNLGTVTIGTGFVSMSDNGIQLMIVDGTAGFILTLAGNVFTTIVDGNFPNGATTVTFIDGRFIVDKTGSRQYYVCQSYDGTLWTPVVFGTKENSSDQLQAVDVLNGIVILWGSTSIEFWQDAGTPSNPFARINGASQTWGLAAKWSRAALDNTMVFLAQNPQGSIQIMKLNGYTPQRISTSDIEHIINSFSTFTDAVALTYIIDGHPMYQLTFPTGGRSFLYDNLTGWWQEVQTGLSLTARHYGNLGIVFNTINYISDYQSGNIYQFVDDAYTDNGTPIKRQVITRHIRNGGNQFGISEIFLDMETGVGLQTGQGSDPKLMVQTSKDGGRTFGIERLFSIGLVGQYFSPRVIMRRFGMARDFVFKFTMTDPVKFVIASASATASEQEGKNA